MRITRFVLVLAASSVAACGPAQFTSGPLPPAPVLPAARVDLLPPAPVLPAPAFIPRAHAAAPALAG